MASNNSKVWLITGSSTGFGRALSEAVIKKGDLLVATARKPEQLDDLVNQYPEQVKAVRLDVTNREDIRAAVKAAMDVFGRIDVLVNNAGYGTIGAIEEISDEAIEQQFDTNVFGTLLPFLLSPLVLEIEQQFDTNVFGTLNTIRAVLPIMRQQHSGHILNLSSVGGMVSFAATGIYCSTKFAVEGLSEALAKEVAPLGIKVTIVEPGAFRTDFNGRSLSVPDRQIGDYAETTGKFLEWLQQMDGQQPGDPEKAAQAMIQAVESDEPPLRLALGEDAVNAIALKLESVKAELDEWQAVSLATAFEGATVNAVGG